MAEEPKGTDVDDTLESGSGDDKLYGGDGKDTLEGGEGRDSYTIGFQNNVIDTIRALL